MIPIIIFFIFYVRVFARAFQQRNVVHNNWALVPIFSYLMSYMEILGLSLGIFDIMQNGLLRIVLIGFVMGTGGWLGTWTAMFIHNRFRGYSI